MPWVKQFKGGNLIKKIRKIKEAKARLIEAGIDPVLALAELAVAAREEREIAENPSVWKDRAALELSCLKELVQYSSPKLKAQEVKDQVGDAFVFKFVQSAGLSSEKE